MLFVIDYRSKKKVLMMFFNQEVSKLIAVILSLVTELKF